MAEERSLREVNLNLLSRLHVVQKGIWKELSSIKTKRRPEQQQETSNFEGFGPDRTPVTLRNRQKAQFELSTKITPRQHGGKGTVRFSTPRRSDQTQNQRSADKKRSLNSILKTPQSQSKRPIETSETPFQPSTSASNVKNSEQSLLGYDWIAGMLDNDSYISQKDDSFFDEMKEFRRVNRSECTGSSILRNPTKSPLEEIKKLPQRLEDEKYHKCSDTYVLDDRLFAVPIHGSESFCSLCKTKKPAEYENQDNYIRISVPRSTLQSPQRVKPHRRKSFDPTDSVSLSKHCLLGWQSSKPTIIPSQSALDLRAHTGISKLNSLNWSNPSLKTSELLRNHSGFVRGQPVECDNQLQAFRHIT